MKWSYVWKYFTKVETEKALCNKCNKKLAFKNSTSILNYHLKKMHKIAKKEKVLIKTHFIKKIKPEQVCFINKEVIHWIVNDL